MTTSDRPSRRVVDGTALSQVSTPELHNSAGDVRPASGADGERLLARSKTARIGRRRRAELQASLSDRDMAVLRSLEQLHYLTSRQLERLLYQGSGLTPLSAARTVNRDLARLRSWRLIEPLERRIGGLHAGSAATVWTLHSPGYQLLRQGSRQRSHEPSRLHLAHVLEVAEVVVQLHERQRTGAIELVSVEAEPACWRRLPSGYGGSLICKPDLRLVVASGDQELHWAVELDRGTEHRPVLLKKCRTYLDLWRTGQEQRQHGVFPAVVWVVPDSRRAEVIEDVIHDLAEAPAGMFEVTTSDRATDVLSGQVTT